ncbi:putative nuclease HARBI1 [Saccostrea echinata]|uniref:putative nuclease HARBI1 n=1 Tax=Saccostrea echinata TaxID=191078 RepID=UPI002A82923E|nr:putative nuclease HARBI1 [Saccostrea echinata]
MAVRRHLQRRRRRRNSILRRMNDRSNPLETLNEAEVFERYRFVPETIMFIVGLIQDQLLYDSQRNNPLTPLYQVLVALRYFATGSFYITLGDTLSVSKSTAGRAVRRVTDLLCTQVRQFVRLPDRNESICIKSAFHKIAGFPSIVGCVDGTMIKIIAPAENESDYLCRKGYYALNIQMTCDPQFRVLDVVARWPGSVHDARIFRESSLCKMMEEGQLSGILLGDSGYGLKPYLMTPYMAEDAPGNRRFNTAHCRTRLLFRFVSSIEQQTLQLTISILEISSFRTKPERACRIVTACTILHNIGIERRDILQDADVMNDVCAMADDLQVQDDAVGRTVRDHIRDTYFL